jgi:hypothetical protein
MVCATGHLLGVILADEHSRQNLADLLRRWNAVTRLYQRGLVPSPMISIQFDALVADENGRAGDELAHLVLALATERAVKRILGSPLLTLLISKSRQR